METRQGYGAVIRRGARGGRYRSCLCLRAARYLRARGPDQAAAVHQGMRVRGRFTDGSPTSSGPARIWACPSNGGTGPFAKIIEALFTTSYLSDVGCTFRVVSRERVARILPLAQVDGSSFGLEMLMLAGDRPGENRPGSGQLPPASRPLVGHRQPVEGHPAGPCRWSAWCCVCIRPSADR